MPKSTPRSDRSALRPELARLQVFTTGEAAEVAGVSQQTIIRNFDAGRLRGYRVPGSRFRRIPREHLIAFLASNGLPVDGLRAGGKRRVLVIDDAPDVLAFLKSVLLTDGRFSVKVSTSGYEAGLLSASFAPELILLNHKLRDIDGDRVCHAVKENADLAGTRVLIVSDEATPPEIEQLLDAGADGFLARPFEASDLLDQVELVLGLPAVN